MKGCVLPWTSREDQMLRSLHGTMPIPEVAQRIGRSRGAVRGRITRLGIAKKVTWTAVEELQLVELYNAAGATGVINLKAFADSVGRDKTNVCRKAAALGLPTNQSRRKVDERKDRRKFKGDADALKAAQRQPKWNERPHPRGMAGKKHTEETKAIMGLRSRDRWLFLSDEKKEEMTLKALKSRRAKGPLAPRVARGTWKADWREIGGQRCYFRSSWEANYARYLEWLRSHGQVAAWEHEPETFWFEAIKRGVRSYLPDFRVTENNGARAYHEVKGWMDSRSKTTIRRFRKYYPDETLIVIDGKAYEAIRRKVAGMIEGWE